jgi:hypothetical protein
MPQQFYVLSVEFGVRERAIRQPPDPAPGGRVRDPPLRDNPSSSCHGKVRESLLATTKERMTPIAKALNL